MTVTGALKGGFKNCRLGLFDTNALWRGGRIAAITLAACAVAVLAGCKEKQEARQMPPRAVTAATVEASDLPLYIDTLGRTMALESVKIMPQVSGTLEKISFTQGTEVKKGDLLFQIDPALYRAAVTQAEGALAQAQAQLDIDKLQVERSRSLVPDKLISEQEFQALEAKVAGDKGAVELAKGQLESAKVNLGYAEIRSPIDGMIGFHEVSEGNIVSAAAGTVLTTIQRMDQLYVDFIVTDAEFALLREHFRAQGNKLPLQVRQLSGKGQPVDGGHVAELTILGNDVSRSTGTVRLRGVLDNAGHPFWPDQPVAVRVILETVKGALSVPTGAVGIGQMGSYVFIIENKDGRDVVQQIAVTVGQSQDNGNTVVILEGLSAGQRVVIDGQVFLQSGEAVAIRMLDGVAQATAAKGAAPQAAAKSGAANSAAKSVSAKEAASQAAGSKEAAAQSVGSKSGAAKEATAKAAGAKAGNAPQGNPAAAGAKDAPAK